MRRDSDQRSSPEFPNQVTARTVGQDTPTPYGYSTSYAYEHATSQTEAHTSLIPVAVQAIAVDFEERYDAQDVLGVAAEWAAYLRDIGGYGNFPSYAACQLIRLTAPVAS